MYFCAAQAPTAANSKTKVDAFIDLPGRVRAGSARMGT